MRCGSFRYDDYCPRIYGLLKIFLNNLDILILIILPNEINLDNMSKFKSFRHRESNENNNPLQCPEKVSDISKSKPSTSTAAEDNLEKKQTKAQDVFSGEPNETSNVMRNKGKTGMINIPKITFRAFVHIAKENQIDGIYVHTLCYLLGPARKKK